MLFTVAGVPPESPAKRQNAGKGARRSTAKSLISHDAPWEIASEPPRIISGIELSGDHLLHSIYLEETGISAKEPIALVAGVIINEDLQWKAVERAVAELITEFVPVEHREGFSFHATDLYHCSGKIFHHSKYPRERAREALKRLLSIPRRFALPVSMGYLTKSTFKPTREFDASGKAKLHHAIAYFSCVITAERHMVLTRPPQELARLIAEHNAETHEVVRLAHKLLQGKIGPELIEHLTKRFGPGVDFYLPLRRIIDTVHFAEKDDAILLQLADACALILRYWAEGKSGQYIDEYFDAFAGPESEFKTTQRRPVFNCTWLFRRGLLNGG
jgi:hypothetical protein